MTTVLIVVCVLSLIGNLVLGALVFFLKKAMKAISYYFVKVKNCPKPSSDEMKHYVILLLKNPSLGEL